MRALILGFLSAVCLPCVALAQPACPQIGVSGRVVPSSTNYSYPYQGRIDLNGTPISIVTLNGGQSWLIAMNGYIVAGGDDFLPFWFAERVAASACYLWRGSQSAGTN